MHFINIKHQYLYYLWSIYIMEQIKIIEDKFHKFFKLSICVSAIYNHYYEQFNLMSDETSFINLNYEKSCKNNI